MNPNNKYTCYYIVMFLILLLCSCCGYKKGEGTPGGQTIVDLELKTKQADKKEPVIGIDRETGEVVTNTDYRQLPQPVIVAPTEPLEGSYVKKYEYILDNKKKPISVKDVTTPKSSIDDYSFGTLAYEIAHEMRVAKTYDVKVAIGRPELKTHASYSSSKFTKENIKVYPYMSASLVYDKQDFEVLALSDENQIMDSITEWRFKVKPLRAGKKKIVLKVSARIHVENKDEFKTLPIVEREVLVRVSIPQVIITALKNNWKELLGLLFSSGIVGIIVKRRKGRSSEVSNLQK